MNQLSRHIEILLLSNDCVVVPDFGGFVAHWVPASYDDSDRTFLPPMRTLGFNSHLRMNDSLLAQSYVEAYDISYPEALRHIEKDVEDLRQQLQAEGSYTLTGLGTLTLNMDGNYEFEPFRAGILSPEIYGLSGVAFKRLRDEAVPEEVAVNAAEPQDAETASPALLDFMPDEEEDSKSISVKMSWIRNAVAIAAAVVAFFVFATPVVNSDLGNQSMSQLQGNILYKMLPQDTNVSPANPVIAEKAEAAVAPKTEPAATADKQESSQSTMASVKAAEATARQAEATAKPAAEGRTYYIVLASQVKKSNAEEFVNQLHQKGYAEAEIFLHNGILRVVCGSFNSEAEAYSRLAKLRNNEEFAEAWIYKKSV